MPPLGPRTFTVEIIGFSPADRTVFASTFALSKRRTYQYVEYIDTPGQAPRKRPDLFLADTDDLRSMVVLTAKSPDAMHPAILIGSESHGLQWELVERPVRWTRLFEALDKSVERAEAARAGVPEEKRWGWPFFDRRKRNRLDLELGSEPITAQPGEYERTNALNPMKPAPTVAMLDPEKLQIGSGPGSVPLVRDPQADTVLVVDDNVAARRFLATQLARFGVNIDFAATGEQALGLIARKRYVCVLLDTTLPGIDGYQTCRMIKAEASLAPSIVMFSDTGNPLDRIRARIAGCDAFLDKQVELGTLVVTLARYAAPRTYATVVAALP